MPQALIKPDLHVPDTGAAEAAVRPPDTLAHVPHRVVLPGEEEDRGIRFIRFRFSCFSMQAIPRSISRKSPMVGSPPQRGSARYWSTFSVLAESQSYPVRLGANF